MGGRYLGARLHTEHALAHGHGLALDGLVLLPQLVVEERHVPARGGGGGGGGGQGVFSGCAGGCTRLLKEVGWVGA